MADREARNKPKKTAIGAFFGRLSRSKSRGSDVDKERTDSTKNVSTSKSDGNIKSSDGRRSFSTSHREAAANFLEEEARMSPARRLFNRFSNLRSTGRFKTSSSHMSNDSINFATNDLSIKTSSEHDLHAIHSPKTDRCLAPPSGVPTGAQSETDLRFVTSRDSHKSIPLEESFGFGEKSPRAFMSESDLSSGATDFAEVNRTPSYLRVSCALNGYTRSPKKADLTSKITMGESFVESSTPIVPLQNNRLNALLGTEMGNHVSTPQPIRDLISKFDRLDLCGSNKTEKGGLENIEPHNFIVNQQPIFDEIDLKKEVNVNEDEKQREVPNLKISTDAESDSGISGSSPASSKRNVELTKYIKENEDQMSEVTTSTPSNGNEFKNLHDTVKAELQEKMDAAYKDLENSNDYPEKCSDSLRAAHGNAHLLVKKKFSKFNELIDKNLNPIPNDPMPVTVQDLEGFWMTIEMELKGIMNEFKKVEKYRESNWDPSAVENEEPDTTIIAAPKSRPLTAKKKTSVVSEETKKKLAEQKALAEQRRAEMRAQMRQKMKAKNEEETIIGASSEC